MNYVYSVQFLENGEWMWHWNYLNLEIALYIQQDYEYNLGIPSRIWYRPR